jgi:hypothetical protein
MYSYLDDAILAALSVWGFASGVEDSWLKIEKRRKKKRRGKRRNVKGATGVVKWKEGPHALAVLWCYFQLAPFGRWESMYSVFCILSYSLRERKASPEARPL